MYKLTYVKRVWIVKQIQQGVPAAKVALSQNVSRMAVWKIVQSFNQYGWDGLRDHVCGRPQTELNPRAQELVLEIRKKWGYGACRIEEHLKRQGYGITHRQIEKVLVRHNLVLPNVKKQKPRKWVRYEMPHPNDLWHTDWTHDPFTDENFSVYLDDRTRVITSHGIFHNANTQNSLALLAAGIAHHGKPKAVMTDHGVTYYNNTPDRQGLLQLNAYQVALNEMSIKHCLARINRPQTNGKVERFFLTYKTEYATGSFRNITDFITHYNKERPHMSLNNKTPQQVWEELM